MATRKVYDECCRSLKQHPLIGLKGNGKQTVIKEPDLSVLSEPKLVNEEEFQRCSEAEKRRHLNEDFYLRSTYIELNTNVDLPVMVDGSAAFYENAH
jgi:hypothetical protein